MINWKLAAKTYRKRMHLWDRSSELLAMKLVMLKSATTNLLNATNTAGESEARHQLRLVLERMNER